MMAHKFYNNRPAGQEPQVAARGAGVATCRKCGDKPTLVVVISFITPFHTPQKAAAAIAVVQKIAVRPPSVLGNGQPLTKLGLQDEVVGYTSQPSHQGPRLALPSAGLPSQPAAAGGRC